MISLTFGLCIGAAFLLGLRTGIAIGTRSARRRKGDVPLTGP
jgi:hypothetical protein